MKSLSLRTTAIFLLTSSLLLTSFLLRADPPMPDTTNPTPVILGNGILSIPQFHQKILQLRKQIETANIQPTELTDLVLKRMKDRLSISPETVRQSVFALRTWENTVQFHKDMTHKTIFTYPLTNDFIETLLPLADGQPQIQALLLYEEARNFDMQQEREPAAATFTKSARILTTLHTDTDLQRLQALSELAHVYFLDAKSDLADKTLRRVLSYDWYKIEDPQKIQEFKNIYIRSSMQFIDLHRASLKDLEDMHFIPAAMDELGPYLEKAKSAAQQTTTPPQKPSP